MDYEDLDNEKKIPYDPLGIPDLIVSFSECFSPALEKLDVVFESYPSYIEDIIADRSYVLGFNAVAPLLSFNRLTELHLNWICTSAINGSRHSRNPGLISSDSTLEVQFVG